MRSCFTLCAVVLVIAAGVSAGTDVLQRGGDRLVALQNNDGGWDWPLFDSVLRANAPETFAPTAMGLAQVYRVTGDPKYRGALVKASGYLVNKPPLDVTPEEGYIAAALDDVFGGTKHVDFVKKSFYDPLAKGTYVYVGESGVPVNVDTAQYVWFLRVVRHAGLSNLAALDCGLGLYSAHMVGADTKAWVDGTKPELEALNVGDGYDVLGLAGAILGLASVKEDIDPQLGEYESASSLADLARILSGLQLATGGFTWNSRCMQEDMGNEGVEETAVALMALNAVDGDKYRNAITRAAAFLKKAQLPTGGWANPSQGEFNQLTGEALWAIGRAEQLGSKQPAAVAPVPKP